MHSVLGQMLSSQQVVARDGSTIPLNSQISPEEGNAIQRLIRVSKPQVSLEVGLAYGVSALYICEALTEVGGTKHIVIDPYQCGAESIAFVAGKTRWVTARTDRDAGTGTSTSSHIACCR